MLFTDGMFVIFFILILFLPNNYSSSDDNFHGLKKPGQELLICKKCGTDILDSQYILNKVSPGARRISIQNLFGRANITVQTLVNPYGVIFDIITSEKARCKNFGPKQGADSWYPGYTWKICTCPHCVQPLGWTFTSDTNNDESENEISSFYGIILNNVLGENFTDSLLMMPKTYRV